MKKVFSVLIAVMIAAGLVLTACGGSPSSSSTPASTPDASVSTPASTPSTPEDDSTSTPAAGPVAEEVQGVTIPNFSVQVNEATITQTEMANYPMYSVQATSTNSSGTESTVTYVGFMMKDLLAAAELTEDYVWLQAIATDGYAVTLTGDIIAEDTTLLAVTKDGSPLDAGPWFAPCSSQTTGNYLKDAAAILVNTVEGAPDIEVQTGGGEGDDASATGSLPEILDRTDKVEFAPYSFLVNGTEVTNDTLADLSIYKITATVTDNAGNVVEADYTGYKLLDVLTAAGAGTTNVKAVASDGFESTLTADMVNSDYTLIAIEKDKETGEDGTVWVAPCAQETAGSYAKLVVEIVAS